MEFANYNKPPRTIELNADNTAAAMNATMKYNKTILKIKEKIK